MHAPADRNNGAHLMAIVVTLLISAGEPDPTWPLTPVQEREFLEKLAASPVPGVSVGPPGRRDGYGGIMARDGAGERWVVYRGWIRGGPNSRVDDKRVLEQWLLETGRNTIAPKLFSELSRQITPPA
jgi:hypothetical protein